jgi:hypothetical protein
MTKETNDTLSIANLPAVRQGVLTSQLILQSSNLSAFAFDKSKK